MNVIGNVIQAIGSSGDSGSGNSGSGDSGSGNSGSGDSIEAITAIYADAVGAEEKSIASRMW